MAAWLIQSCGPAKQKVDDSAINNPIVVALDLTTPSEDKVTVIVDPGRFNSDTETFRLPRVVQGTYSISDFGKYIEDFKALDYDGNELTTI